MIICWITLGISAAAMLVTVVCSLYMMRLDDRAGDRAIEEHLVVNNDFYTVHHRPGYWEEVTENGKYKIVGCDAWLSSGEPAHLEILIPNKDKEKP